MVRRKAEHKWSIVDKEVHIERENRAVSVFSINKDREYNWNCNHR